MAYTVFQHDARFGPRKGLEGPFHYPNGATLYYDPKEGKYYDPLTDLFLDDDGVAALQDLILDLIRG